jgi:hypothetical protein
MRLQDFIDDARGLPRKRHQIIAFVYGQLVQFRDMSPGADHRMTRVVWKLVQDDKTGLASIDNQIPARVFSGSESLAQRATFLFLGKDKRGSPGRPENSFGHDAVNIWSLRLTGKRKNELTQSYAIDT